MDFKLVSKNNFGIVTTLILVILLSQSKFFNFLTNNATGRIILLAFVIYIAYVHKMMGLVAVLFIIIAFDFNGTNTVHSYNFYEQNVVSLEGFGVSSNSITTDDKKDGNKEMVDKDKLKKAKELIDSLDSTKATTSSSAPAGREGFNMSDKEITMLRGKQSNAIPVQNSRGQSDDVSPSDKSVFSDSYASF